MSYQRWTEDENVRLLAMFDAGKQYKEIAYELIRTEKSVAGIRHKARGQL